MQLTDPIKQDVQSLNRYNSWTRAGLLLLILILGWTTAARADYSFRKRITINHAQVSQSCTHLYDFPVLINIQGDPDLAAHVVSGQGYDIVFKDENGNQLDHEVLRYNSDGSLLAFVRLP